MAALNDAQSCLRDALIAASRKPSLSRPPSELLEGIFELMRKELSTGKVSARSVSQLACAACIIYCSDAAAIESRSPATVDLFANTASAMLDRGADILLDPRVCPPAVAASFVCLLLATTRTMQSHARDISRVQAASALQRPAYAAIAMAVRGYGDGLGDGAATGGHGQGARGNGQGPDAAGSSGPTGRGHNTSAALSSDALWLLAGISVAVLSVLLAIAVRPEDSIPVLLAASDWLHLPVTLPLPMREAWRALLQRRLQPLMSSTGGQGEGGSWSSSQGGPGGVGGSLGAASGTTAGAASVVAGLARQMPAPLRHAAEALQDRWQALAGSGPLRELTDLQRHLQVAVPPWARPVLIGTVLLLTLPPLLSLCLSAIQNRPGRDMRKRIVAFLLGQRDVRSFLQVDQLLQSAGHWSGAAGQGRSAGPALDGYAGETTAEVVADEDGPAAGGRGGRAAPSLQQPQQPLYWDWDVDLSAAAGHDVE